MACVAVNSLMRTLEIEFLQSRPRPILQENEVISFNRELIESLHERLGSLLEELDEKRIDGSEAIKHLETQLGDVAFRVEDEIEMQVVDLYVKSPQEDTDVVKAQGCLVLCQIFHQPKRKHQVEKTRPSIRLPYILQQAIADIDAIKEELEKVKMDGKQHAIDLQGRENKDEVFMMGNSSQHATPHSKYIMVRKNNELSTVVDMLIQHPSKKREVVSIKGMGGIGKTTLARRVYDDSSVRSHFDRKAWAVVSQLHNKTQMLISLLNSMGNTERGRDEDDLALKLYQILKGQRYLIVIDDVWSGEAWDCIKACLPDDNNGSRILLTTRLEEVANYTRQSNDFSLQMKLLDQTESWHLFYEKACRSRTVDFEMIGRPIVEKCKGLPLAIIIVAGLFSKLNTLYEWKNIAKSLNSIAAATLDEECSKILSLSYNHLPSNLKACFLYLGVFPEDFDIKASHLARLWSAEGLVKAYENESFEMVAKRYIQELMDRNLILVTERSCCKRKIKSFRMHDILHNFCVKEAQTKNLLHVMRENGSDFPHKDFRWLSIQTIDFDIYTLYSY